MKTQKSKFAIVNLVCKLLNLGEFAKIENFVTRVIKTLTSEVKNIERNIETVELGFRNITLEYQDKVEDLEGYIEEAYANIDPEALKNNDAMDKYMEAYLKNIAKLENELTRLESTYNKDKESHENIIKDFKADINWRLKRINKLSS